MTVARHAGARRAGAFALEICAVAALYWGSAEIGLLQQQVRGQVTPMWPPSGIALAGLLLRGPRVWPGIALGAFLVNISLGPSLPAVLAIAAGNTLAPVCSYALLRRAGFRSEMNRLRDALALIFLGAFTGMLVSATVGTGTLVLTGVLDAGEFWATWSVWWTGDAVGVLAVTPVVLLLRSARRPQGVSLFRWVEGILLVAVTICVGFIETSTTPLLFLGFPLLVWAAFRFGLAGAAPCALAVSTFAIIAAAQNTGPFAGHDLFTNMITLQAFNGSVSLTALLLGAAVNERTRTEKEIALACGQLAEMVTKIAATDRRPALDPEMTKSPEMTKGPAPPK
ncbi:MULTISPECIES: MASE1 domain-containing protein [Streptomyces]|uniref:MASE1 domain-containing protein n=1 Tax=Streptomyces koelreuteriae TaxID=2838015 RepID=A0ABX8FL63_9ACTN|nr:MULTISPECIES: MASE1 domain-containing protein [Streptomyces]QWB21792.1 MASE1 domain-containing protein [Streptomyces koelreuteriae]UUA04722.1 MASE1 domain-containing protein [Streptomyces koelreuteriae]UUA12346.1 MASE1 domain-containing protein [Streptomyces sp. CRCS-T-1]